MWVSRWFNSILPDVKRVYALLDPDSGKIRYVGLTGLSLKERARLHRARASKSDYPVHVWIRSLNRSPDICLLQEVKDDVAVAAEAYWIGLLHEVPTTDLLNVNGISGRRKPRKMTGATKEKLSNANKGRIIPPSRRNHFKLSEEQVEAVKNAPGTQRQVAKEFGISQVMVHRIKTGKSWS